MLAYRRTKSSGPQKVALPPRIARGQVAMSDRYKTWNKRRVNHPIRFQETSSATTSPVRRAPSASSVTAKQSRSGRRGRQVAMRLRLEGLVLAARRNGKEIREVGNKGQFARGSSVHRSHDRWLGVAPSDQRSRLARRLPRCCHRSISRDSSDRQWSSHTRSRVCMNGYHAKAFPRM